MIAKSSGASMEEFLESDDEEYEQLSGDGRRLEVMRGLLRTLLGELALLLRPISSILMV